ncbi:MAG: KH domain-containing protein [Calditrichia bacterium]|nr:KH domain-containing protein [Calditrichia bacterium]
MLKEFLEHIVKPIVDKPDEIKITEVDGEAVCIYELRVGEGDFGKVLGKHGKNVNALRTLLNAVASKSGKRAILELIE